MASIRTVLCPVDLSPATPRQIDLAADLCRTFAARLILHHNLSATGAGAAVGWMWAADHPVSSEHDVEQAMRTLLARASRGVDVEARITRGPASQAVLALAEAVDADLVVLSTHGATTEDHTSVTEQVLEGARRAVLALHDAFADSRLPAFDDPSGARQVVVVPTDLTPESHAAVELAWDLAHRLPIDPHLVHFLPHGARDADLHSSAREDARRRMRLLVPDDLSAQTTLHLEDGDAAEGIARVAAGLAAACIVMGEHTRAPLRRWLSRNTSRAVLHTAPCPVWYVPGRRCSTPVRR